MHPEWWQPLDHLPLIMRSIRSDRLKRSAWIDGLNILVGQVQAVPSIKFELPVALVDKDRPILCTAIRSKCAYLATGDRRDFGHPYDQTIQGVTVITLARLAEIVTQG